MIDLFSNYIYIIPKNKILNIYKDRRYYPIFFDDININ